MMEHAGRLLLRNGHGSGHDQIRLIRLTAEGRRIEVGKLYAGTNFINPPGYSASKAALLAFTRYTASFWGPFSNVEENSENSVSPDDPFLERLKARTVLGRVGSPRELVGALLYLASDASNFTTGQALVVDGGWTIV
jgi:gluconate 5-dehydrogenase